MRFLPYVFVIVLGGLSLGTIATSQSLAKQGCATDVVADLNVTQ
ncbi:hypothetical protein [Aestuariibius sp. HNIBRBA575]